jgi:hypothetical protein
VATAPAAPGAGGPQLIEEHQSHARMPGPGAETRPGNGGVTFSVGLAGATTASLMWGSIPRWHYEHPSCRSSGSLMVSTMAEACEIQSAVENKRGARWSARSSRECDH